MRLSLLAVAGVALATLLPNVQAAQSPQWKLATPKAGFGEAFVAAFSARDFGANGDGVQDNTTQLQAAIKAVTDNGGGTLFIPAGRYVVKGQLNVPSGVCLRGEWKVPAQGEAIGGTILMAYAGRGQDEVITKRNPPNGLVASLITLNNSAALRNVAIWYPEQNPAQVVPYPPAVLMGGNYATVEDVTLVNAYRGIASGQDNGPSCFNIRNIIGSPLSIGVEIDDVADVGRLQNINFSPDFWINSGLPGAPTGEIEWIKNNGTGINMRRNDWSYANKVTIKGYGVGIRVSKSLTSPDAVPNGYFDDVTLSFCGIGVKYEEGGVAFSRLRIYRSGVAIQCDPTFAGILKLHTSILSCDKAIEDNGTGRVLIQKCTIAGTIKKNAGFITLIDSSSSAPSPQITLASGVQGASILGNRFAQPLQISADANVPVQRSDTPLPSQTITPVSFADDSKYRPARAALFVVTDATYGAEAGRDGDATAGIQKALNAAAQAGGGTVLILAGEYAIRGSLTVAKGVELRGTFDWPHDTIRAGTILYVYGGRDNANAPATISLAAGSGACGFTVVYPEQKMDDVRPYPFFIQMGGADCYATDIAALNPYQFLDANTFKCDRHFIARVTGSALNKCFVIGGGSVNGRIEDCQQNAGNIAFGQESWRGGWEFLPELGPSEKYRQSEQLVFGYQWDNFDNYILGNCQNEILYNNFCFGGRNGLTLGIEGQPAPTGVSFGTAFDQNTRCLVAEKVGAAGFPIIQGQFVTVGNDKYPESAYFYVGKEFKGNLPIIISDMWGNARNGMVVEGGNLLLEIVQIRNPGANAFSITDGSIRATNVVYDQNSRLGSPDTVNRLSLTAAVLPNIYKDVAQTRNWEGTLFRP